MTDNHDEPEPLSIADAIALAVKVLHDKNATEWQRCNAADELIFALEGKDENK